MKKTFLLLLIIQIISCKSDSEKKNIDKNENVINNPIVEEIRDNQTIKKINEKENLIDYNISYIKSQTSKLSDIIDLDSVDFKNLKKIPKRFLEKYISSHKIDFGTPEYLPSDYPESYSFYQSKSYENFFLFTIIHENEFCCKTLYAVTTRKDKISIINISVIGLIGMDGGWYGKRFGKWFNDYGIGSTLINSYDEDLIEENNKTEIDTTWSEYEFSKKGTIKHIEHHRVKYKGNEQIE